MTFIELLLIAIGLSMDAFAVAICKGLAMGKMNIKGAVTVGLYFGGFQALMPLIGYFLGSSFRHIIEDYDHWAAFILLALIGAGMIKEAMSRDEEAPDPSLDVKSMTLLAIATSIDALAAGVTFAFLRVDIFAAVCFIGAVTFCFGITGVKLGSVFGCRYKSRAEFTGGIILIFMGLKILLEHLGILA